MGSVTELAGESGMESGSTLSDTLKQTDEVPDNMDPVVREWDMYLNVSPDIHVILLRYPEPEVSSPYSDLFGNKPIEFRIKPISGLIEVDVPIDPHDDTFDRLKGITYGEAMRKSKVMKERGGSYGIAGGFGLGGSSMRSRPGAGGGLSTDGRDLTVEELLDDYDEAIKNGHVMTKVTLGGHINIWNETSPNLYVGRFRDASVFFTKVDALCVLRPQLVHIDAINDQRKSTLRMQSGADTEENEVVHVNMTIKKSEGESMDSVGDTSEVTKLLKTMREEPWQRLFWVDSEDPEAYEMFNETFTPSEHSRRPQLTCNMTNEQWLDAISCPRIDPINPNKKTMRRRQEEDDLSSTENSEGNEEAEHVNH